MGINVKKILPLIMLLIMVVAVLPLTFAADDINQTISINEFDDVVSVNDEYSDDIVSDSEYKYTSTPDVSSVDYTKGESCVVDVSAEYESEDYWSSLDLTGSSIYVYVDGASSGIELSSIPSESKSFSVDLKDIDFDFEEGNSYSLVFRPPNGILNYADVNLNECQFNPLTVNVVSGTPTSTYDYETNVDPNNIEYVRGESKIISVSAKHGELGDLEEGITYWKVFINGDANGILIDGVDAVTDSFTFNIMDISDKLVDGENTIVFHPNQGTLENWCYYDTFNYNPLTVTVTTPKTSEIEAIYVSQDGDDNNDGTKDSKVASIAKAINLVKETGITNIIVSQGKYRENGLIIDTSLNIYGEGEVIIDAEEVDRIFKINGYYDVILANLTLINGNAPTDGVSEDIHEIVYYAAGGAISIVNDAYVHMENMTFIQNYAETFGGAINSESSNCTLFNCIFINNTAGVFGGAVDFEAADCSIENCQFISNDATNGGAVGWIGDNAKLINSYFENNTADIGAAIFIENTENSEGNLIQYCKFINNIGGQQGGAIEVENEQMSSNVEYTQIRNCEFINNTAFNGGAISGYYGDVASLDNIFINNTAGYGGAIATISTKSYLSYVGQLYLRNNTIINCIAEENGNGIFTMGYIESVINITFLEGKTISIPDGKAVDLTVTVCDDMGNPISGSPVDFTVNGEATINQASDLIEGTGQVHFVPRENGTFTVSGIYGSEYDMLHYYNVITGTIIVDNAIPDYFGTIYVSEQSGDDDNTGSMDSPVKTFNQAYLLAVREGGSYSIIVNKGTYYVPGYTITKSFNVTGIDNPVLDGKNQKTLFSLHGEADTEFYFTGLTFINGVASASRDASMYDGGVIFFKGGKLFLENDRFNKNSATDYGGAVYINKGLNMQTAEFCTAYAEIKNCTFENNFAKYDGGAIGLYEADVIVINSTFNSNSAKYGGAISILSGRGNLTVINSSFNKNSALEFGGALETEALDGIPISYYANIINSTFKQNTAKIGGAIVGQMTNITSCTFIENEATQFGGAVSLADNKSSISNSIFEKNNAPKGSAYSGNTTLIEGNYWGSEVESSQDLVKNNIININSTDKAPETWYNSADDLTNGKIINPNINDTDNNITNNTNSNQNTKSQKTAVKTKKTKSIIKVTKKAFKAKTKVKKVKITLKTSTKKAIKKVKVTLKVKGKTYKVKTNKKGVATFKIKLNKKGSFKATVKFAGNKYYKATSKKFKIKIK